MFNPQTDMVSFSSSKNVLESATFNGTFGLLSDIFDNAAGTLLEHAQHKDLFSLEAECRAKRFTRTCDVFTRGAACAGSLVADVLMAPYDFLMGRGQTVPEKATLKQHIKAEGIIGLASMATTTGVSFYAEASSMGAGAIVGAISSPLAYPMQTSPKEWILNTSKGLGKLIGTLTCAAVGFTLGLALDALRFASLAVKLSISSVFAICGGIIGFFGGCIRAAFNV